MSLMKSDPDNAAYFQLPDNMTSSEAATLLRKWRAHLCQRYADFDGLEAEIREKRKVFNNQQLQPKQFPGFIAAPDLHDCDGLLSRLLAGAADLPDYRGADGRVMGDHIFRVFLSALERSDEERHTGEGVYLTKFLQAYEANRAKSSDESVRNAAAESYDLELLNRTVRELTKDAVKHVERFRLTRPFTQKDPPPLSKVAEHRTLRDESRLHRRDGPRASSMSILSEEDRFGPLDVASEERQEQFEREEWYEHQYMQQLPNQEDFGLSDLEQAAIAHSILPGEDSPEAPRCGCCGFTTALVNHTTNTCPMRNPRDKERISVSIYRVAEMKEIGTLVFLHNIFAHGAFKGRSESQKAKFSETVARVKAQQAEQNRLRKGQYNTGTQYSSSNGARPSNHYQPQPSSASFPAPAPAPSPSAAPVLSIPPSAAASNVANSAAGRAASHARNAESVRQADHAAMLGPSSG